MSTRSPAITDASPDWRPLRAHDRSGIVGLMPAPSAHPTDGSVPTEIGLETSEPLDELALRVQAAEHPVTVADESGPRHLMMTDPDGFELEVYAAS